MLVVFGVVTFITIPRSADPHFPVASSQVTVKIPGLNAVDMEGLVAKPIETALQGLDSVRDVRSRSIAGTAVVYVNFDHGINVDQALDRTIREVESLRTRLPDGIQSITYRRPRTTEAAVLQIALTSPDADWLRMTQYATDLREVLSVVPGVRQIALDGAPTPEVRVSLNVGHLLRNHLSPSAVAEAIGAASRDTPSGAVEVGDSRLDISAGHAFRSLSDLRSLALQAPSGRIITVADIADVTWSESEQLQAARFNDQRALFLTVKQKDGTDAIKLRRALSNAIDHFQERLPPDIALRIGFDQSQDIERKINLLARDFVIALLLVLVTLFPLGWRTALIVIISVPLSLAGGIIILEQFSFSLNQISICGFIISLGLLVDDAIVVVENIDRHRRTDLPPVEAAVVGTRQITAPVASATIVLLLAFAPLGMLPEESGDFIRGLAVAVISTVASSLIVSLTVIPAFAARFLPVRDHGSDAILLWLVGKVDLVYRPLLRKAMQTPRRWLLAALAFCAGVLALIPFIGFSLFPDADTPYGLVRIEAAESSSLEATDRLVRQVSAILAHEPEVANRMENIGGGNPQIYYNSPQREKRLAYGEIFFTLREWNGGSSTLFGRLRAKLANLPDARATLVIFKNGPPVEAPIAIRVSGPKLQGIQQISTEVARVLNATGGTRDVFNPMGVEQPQVDLRLDETKARLMNVAPGEAQRAVRVALSGTVASQLRDDEGNAWPIVVRLPMDGRHPASVLGAIQVPTITGGTVPLSAIAKPQLTSVPPIITRYRLERTNTITAEVRSGYLASNVQKKVDEKLRLIPLPAGYDISVGGEAEAAGRNFAGVGSLLLITTFGILGVLVLEFRRFRETIVVAGIVPFGIIGGIIALLLTGNSLSFLAVVGFIALIGIEIKNSILLVDLTNQMRQDGYGLHEAIEEAASIRFLPILLTSATAIFGLLPLAIGASPLYSPLAWVLIGGLLSSTLLSRLVIPLMYLLAVRDQPVTPEAGVISPTTEIN